MVFPKSSALASALCAAGLLLHATSGAATPETSSAAGPGHEPETAVQAISHGATRPEPSADTSAAEPIVARHPNADAGLAKPYGGTPIDVTTYHYDGLRTGWNATETDLTQDAVKSGKFGLLQTLAVDGNVFAQPLLVSGFKFPDGSKRDVLVVVTAHNSVYAFDAQSYALIWRVNLGTAQVSSHIGCGDVSPEYGISATPVVVRTAANKAALVLVAGTEPSTNVFSTKLHALNLANGADLAPAVEIAPSATLSDGSTLNFDPKNQWARAGLALGKNGVYVAMSSHCDQNAGNISGWVLRYNQKLKLDGTFHTIDTRGGTQLATIWGSGFAPAVDADGNLFAVTGNGNFNQAGKDWGESVLRLPGDLGGVTDFFTPASYQTLNAIDLDFGSSGVMLLPPQGGATPSLALAMGKDATMYLLNRDNLGKSQKADVGALQATRLASSGGGVWGGPAYFASPTGPQVYYQLSSGPMRAFSLAGGTAPTLTQVAAGTTTSGNGGSIPIVSSNGSGAGTGIVWTLRRGSTMTLEGYDAEHLGAPIYSAAAGSWTAGRSFQTPIEANGRVYVPGSSTVTVFGLTP